MNIDKKTVEKIADLARIEVKEAELAGLATEMNKILTFMEQLNKLDTTGVAPLVYMNEQHNVWRADVVVQELTTSEALKNAPLHNQDFFMVPKVIEK